MKDSKSPFKGCPISLKLAGKRCLIVGGGTVAERKTRFFLKYGAEILVVSPRITAGLAKMADENQITCIIEPYHPCFLEDVYLAVGASDDRFVNAALAQECKRRNIPVNIADSPEESDFILPAVLQRGSLQVAVSTGGSSPAYARAIKEELARTYGPEYGLFTDILADLRKQIITRIKNSSARAALLKRISAPAYFRAFQELSPDSFKNLIEKLIEESESIPDPDREVKL